MKALNMGRCAVVLLLMSAWGRAQAGQTFADLDVQEFRYRQQTRWDKDVTALKDIIAVWSDHAGSNAVGLSQYYSKLGTALGHIQDYAGAEQAFRSALSFLQANGPLYDDAYALKSSLPAPEPGIHVDVQPQLVAKAGEAPIQHGTPATFVRNRLAQGE